MRLPLLLASALALAACTAHDTPSDGDGTAAKGTAAASAPHAPAGLRDHRARAIAGLPDRGQLLAYTAGAPVTRSAYTWHDIALSEAHAMNAIATGTLDVPAPDGSTIALKFDHVVDHGDGNWTWVGRPAGTKPGTEAIITFGPKAVFGTVPYGRKPSLRIASAQGRTFLMETDPVKLARLHNDPRRPKGPDSLLPPVLAGARDKVRQRAAAQPGTQALVASGLVPESSTVDVVLGYTNTFASRLGGTSQANTRLTFLVAVANQAFVNSQINGRLRLVGTVPVDYPDATDNEAALRELSGVTCTELSNGGLTCDDAPIPAALQPLTNARETLHADLVSLVRNFSEANVSCGIAWLIGGGEIPITKDDAYAAVSVVSDSNGNGYDDSSGSPFPDNGWVCRNETLAHELGHNMGSAHDATTAAGDDGLLTMDEHGAYPYSFGYKTSAGNFFTIMAYEDDGQKSYRVFSNPRINYCGSACGTADADNARSLSSTIPIVASFYTSLAQSTPIPRSDFNGDGNADILWHNTNGANVLWYNPAGTSTLNVAATAAPWTLGGIGDVNGDGRGDIVWRNTSTGGNSIWLSGNNQTRASMGAVATAWSIAAVADFNGDGKADVWWRHPTTGANVLWRSANVATKSTLANAGTVWKFVAAADFNGDGAADVLWRNPTNGANLIWRSGNGATTQSVNNMPAQWIVAGVGDFDSDGKADILFRNTSTGANEIWRSASSATKTAVATVSNLAWRVAGVGDFDGDGRADIFWRHTNGANQVWKSGTQAQIPTRASVGTAFQPNM